MWELQRKYVFTGTLELKTALHIGGGKVNVSNTDSPVVRTPDGKPFIPGSSFKGVLRSTVEKLAVSIPRLKSCQLTEGVSDCPSVDKEFPDWKREKSEVALINKLDQTLCHTCKLFGSPYSASKIIIQDLPIKEWVEVTQIRDGVVIDRDSERAKDQLKYDFEVVPPSSTFEVNICLENPTDEDLGLACLGLNEFISEMAYIGGIKSRGLGHCKINKEDFTIYELDLASNDKGKSDRLKKYLLNSTLEKKMDRHPNPLQFLQDNINKLI